jgi:hypothetical protein
MPGGGGDIAKTEADLTLMRMNASPPRRWNRGLWIRFVLAITPTVVFAILGYLQTH